MKKIFMTLAAVGLFFSCSKENAEPQLQPSTQQGQETALQVVDPNTPGAVRLSLDADVEPFVVGSGAFVGEDAGQGARATEAIVGGPNINSAISYNITPEADGKVPVLLYLYDSKGIASANVRGTVTKDGKGVSLSLGMLLDPTKVPAGTALERFAKNKLNGVKLAFIIGHDGANTTFTNKGARLITYKAGQKVTLGENYIMLKATEIPLKYDAATKTAKPTKPVTLGMQGYLIGARFRNRFPAKMYKYLWEKPSSDPYATGPTGKERYASPRYAQVIDRPPLDIMFRVDNLSATYKTKISYSTSNGEFSVGRDQEETGANIIRQREMSPGFKASAYDKAGRPLQGKTHGSGERENFLDATSAGVFYVPVGSAPSDTQFSEGEQFVIVYCPNPHDRGSIAYRSPKKLFYDGSPFSQMEGTWKDIGTRIVFHGLANDKNSYVKVQNTPTSPSNNKHEIRRKSADNKFYFVTFTIESNRMDQGSAFWSNNRGIMFPLYDAALKQYKIKK